LAETGEQVTLVGRAHFAESVRRDGLHLTDERGAQTIRDLAATGGIAEAMSTDTYYDLAIFTVKSFDTAAALEELSAASTGRGLPAVLSLQNGVGNEEAIAAVVGGERVIAGTITTPVSVLGPGAIRVDRPSYDLGISPWTRELPAGLLDHTDAALRRAGFAVVRYPHAQGMKWTKLLMNMVGNATSAILDMPPQEVFADDHLADLEIAAWRETLAVMKAAQIPPVNLGSYPFAWLAPLVRMAPRRLLRSFLRSRVGGARGGKLPSLHIDLHTGKSRSEVRWLNGAVVRKGQVVGIDTPVNRLLTETLLSLVGAPQRQAEWRRQPDRLLAAADASK
jgi:2-dehydropantoate 2-reductase